MAEGSSSASCGQIKIKSLPIRHTEIVWEIDDFVQVFFHPEGYPGTHELLSPLLTSRCGNVWQVKIIGKSVKKKRIDEYEWVPVGNHLEVYVSLVSKKTKGFFQYYLSFEPSIADPNATFYYIEDYDPRDVMETVEECNRKPRYIYENPPGKWNGINYYEIEKKSPAIIQYSTGANSTGAVKLNLRIEEQIETVHTHLAPVQDEALSASNQLSDHFGALLESGEFSDITLVVRDRTFAAHKLILSARSEVFRKMLSSDMQESSSNEVKIEDLDADTVQKMLSFMYTGTLPNIKESKDTDKLLYAAEKYQLEHLKNICSNKLAKNINQENAIDLLIKAHLYHLAGLKRYCINFILESGLSQFTEKEDWTKVDQYPELYRDMIKDVYGAPPAKKARSLQ